MQPEEFDWPVVGRKELEAILALSGRHINVLESDGVLQKTGRGLYPLLENVQAYIRHLRDDHKKRNAGESKRKLDEIKGREIEARILERNGGLIQAARQEAISAADQIIGEFVSLMNAVPARVTREVPLRRKIESEIERVFAESAQSVGRAKAGKTARRETADTDAQAAH